jgi:hypothetical protein
VLDEAQSKLSVTLDAATSPATRRAFCFCANPVDIRVARPRRTVQAARMDKLPRAGRDFLLRLVAQHGLDGAARVLRALADEMEALPAERVDGIGLLDECTFREIQKSLVERDPQCCKQNKISRCEGLA